MATCETPSYVAKGLFALSLVLYEVKVNGPDR